MSKDFKPQDYFRYKKLGKRWQKAVGLHSKLREGRKGAGIMPNVGYRTPKKFRGLVGVVKAVVVKTTSDLEKLKENEAVIISSAVGKKKSAAIAEAAGQRGIKILNAKSAAAARKREEEIRKRKEAKGKTGKETKQEKAKLEEKKEKKAEAEAKA